MLAGAVSPARNHRRAPDRAVALILRPGTLAHPGSRCSARKKPGKTGLLYQSSRRLGAQRTAALLR
jgi:hypothetical protein